MKSRHAAFLAGVFLMSGCCTWEMPSEPWDNHNLFYYLEYMGPKLHCKFTQENLNPTDLSAWPWSKGIDGDPSITSIDDLVQLLRYQCKGISVFRDVHHPNVVHLVETVLLRRPDYVMGKQVDVLFSGRLFDLPDEIGQRLGGSIESPRVFSIGGGCQPDIDTKVSIRTAKRTVRDILTGAVPPCYSTFIWYAQTVEEGSNTVTNVHFGCW